MEIEELTDMAGIALEKTKIRKIKKTDKEKLAKKIMKLMHYAYKNNIDLEDLIVNKVEEINKNGN